VNSQYAGDNKPLAVSLRLGALLLLQLFMIIFGINILWGCLVRNKLTILTFILICLFASGCGCFRYKATNEKITTLLNIGMDRDQVISALGIPDKREVYGTSEYLIYNTDCGNMNMETRNVTPILLENNKVVGWGRNYFDNIKRSKVDADITINHK